MPAGLANYNQQKHQQFEVCKHLGLFCAPVKDDATESDDNIIIISRLYEDFQTYPHPVIDEFSRRVEFLSEVRKLWRYRQLGSTHIKDVKAKTSDWVHAVESRSEEAIIVWQDKFVKCLDQGIAGQHEGKRTSQLCLLANVFASALRLSKRRTNWGST